VHPAKKSTDGRATRKREPERYSIGADSLDELHDLQAAADDGRWREAVEPLDVAALAFERHVLDVLDPRRGADAAERLAEMTEAAKILARSLALLLGRVHLEAEDEDAALLMRAAGAYLGNGNVQTGRVAFGRSKETRDALARARVALDLPELARRRGAMVEAIGVALASDDSAGQLHLRLAFIDPRFVALTAEQVSRALTSGGPLNDSGRVKRRNVDPLRVLGELSKLAGVDTPAAFRKAVTRGRARKK
jgi:hypothetical protein